MNIPTLQIPKTQPYFIFPALALLLLAVGRDIHYSLTNESSFYISESLLFNSFWLLFIPFGFFGYVLLQKLPIQNYLLNTAILTSIHLLIFSMVVFSISALFMYHTFGIVWVFTESLSDHWFTCILVYGLIQFLDVKKMSEKKPQNQLHRIKVSHGNQNILLPVEEIQYVKTERPYISLVTKNQDYLHNGTLASFLKNNPNGNFVQIHKSTVINSNAVHAYRSRKNGDYDIEMNNGDIVRASRNYNTNFKAFTHHQDSH